MSEWSATPKTTASHAILLGPPMLLPVMGTSTLVTTTPRSTLPQPAGAVSVRSTQALRFEVQHITPLMKHPIELGYSVAAAAMALELFSTTLN